MLTLHISYRHNSIKHEIMLSMRLLLIRVILYIVVELLQVLFPLLVFFCGPGRRDHTRRAIHFPRLFYHVSERVFIALGCAGDFGASVEVIHAGICCQVDTVVHD